MKPLVTLFAQYIIVSSVLLITPTVSRAAETNEPGKTPANTSTNQPPTAERAPDLQVADRFLLAIPRNGFGKDYLFTASLIPQAQAATSTGLAAKIVRFELFPDGVDLYESTQGLVVTEDLPARRLLATFPILRQNTKEVVIDFNRGMRRVFTQSWTEAALNSDRDRVLEVPEGRVFEMKQEGGRLIVRQSVQARSRQDDPNLEQRYEVRYFVSPYQQGACDAKEPNYTDARYTRFFETEGKIEPITGRVSSRIARFDIRHPIVFHYSANTPADYVEAVKDGILYWNRAFGKEIVQAKKAPDGVTAPDAELNIIQWVPWDNAGFAYADVLLDPLTGESGHGQAFITSVFAFAGKARARALLRAMLDLAEPKKDDKKGSSAARFGVPFLAAAPACQIDPRTFAQQMAQGLEEVLASDELTDAATLRVSQDYVREVVAHEVGHVLGLRHNFAGSLSATLSRKELDDWFKSYVVGKPLDAYTNKLASSSMMEYTVFKGGVFTGWLMRATKEVLPHDRAAITWGYFDNSEAREKKMLFATDDDIGRYGDVRQFDYGTNPVVSAYCEIAQLLDLLPNNVIETFISARAPRNEHDRIPLEQVNLNFDSYARQIANQFADMMSWFRAETRSLRVENQFDFIGDLNRKDRYEAHLKFLNSQVDQLGGVDRAFFSYLPVDLKLDLKQEPAGLPVIQRLSATNLTSKLEKLLDSPTYKNFVGLDEKKYSFTKEERELILKRARKFFEELEKELVKEVCQRLTNAPRTLGIEASGAAGEEDAIAKVEQRVIELAKLVITSKEDSKRVEGKVDKGYVEVVEYKYDQETRLAAAKALDDKTGSFKGWAEDAKSDLNTQLKNDVESALNLSHFKDFKVSLLSRSMREWYQKQQEVLGLLPPAPGSPTLPAR
ncbi:MAG TPA: zinc-dependent metalloprotease [Candidatus Limnocylindrales bacterium]|nr:zinc-dependent metalloprotease [Candidatus Limnocylindrales bacterium]